MLCMNVCWGHALQRNNIPFHIRKPFSIQNEPSASKKAVFRSSRRIPDLAYDKGPFHMLLIRIL